MSGFEMPANWQLPAVNRWGLLHPETQRAISTIVLNRPQLFFQVMETPASREKHSSSAQRHAKVYVP